MKFNKLGSSNLNVSEVCLGTMTYGQQNTEAEAHEQLDYATAQGINFIDCAEMYPVPGRAETTGRTEQYIGTWLKKQTRDKLIIATKITGPARGFSWIRNGAVTLDKTNIQHAIDGSLKRLQTDYVDVYQIHWPERNVPTFGAWKFDASLERQTTPIREQLESLSELVKAGKIRHVALSNETPWGVSEFCKMADMHNLPRVVSIQNAYSLLNRTFEHYLAETCFREKVGLLAYSPLAFGYLTGKYLADPKAPGRINLFEGFPQRYTKANVQPAVKAYVELAQKYHVSPTTLALAFVQSRWFVASNIIGATTMAQLKENIVACQAKLPEEALKEIDALHLRYTSPAP
jgi:aryl-alcohol dehydrogenase-like predicted oxidoreductase